MDNQLVFRQSITIKATQAEVWEALTDPEITPHFMFGCEAVSDWKVGSSLIWRGASDGVHYVVGQVVRFEPKSVLAFTAFDPNGEHEDIPENYLTSTYSLSETNGVTTVEVAQSGFSEAAKGEERYEKAGESWTVVLNSLKELLEQ